MTGKLISILVAAMCVVMLVGSFVTYQAWRYRGLAILAQTDADAEQANARAAEAAAKAAQLQASAALAQADAAWAWMAQAEANVAQAQTRVLQAQTQTSEAMANGAAAESRMLAAQANVAEAQSKTFEALARANAADAEKREVVALSDQIQAELGQQVVALKDGIAELARRVVMRDAGFPPQNRLATSRAIRDFVYRSNLAGASNKAGTDAELIYTSLGRKGYEQQCGGMSLAFAWALDAVGIPARIVQLAAQSFLDGTEQGDTHVTVEAFIEGVWRISDPTFNVEFDCSDGTPNLDVDAARICVAGGHELVPRAGATQIEGRTLDTYYLPFATFLAAYVVPAYEGDGVSAPEQSFPTANWLTEALAKYAPQQ